MNAELGLLLLKRRTAQEAISYLSKAVAALPASMEPWVCLVIAHQRCGNLVRARQVLAQMHAQGFDAAVLAVYEQELNEPTPEVLQALAELIESGNRISAGASARLMSRFVHGNETTSMRMERSIASARLALLESVGFEFGIMGGLRSRGPKPHRMAQVLTELHALVRHLRSQKMRSA
jgi:hypothetical protein